MVLRFSAVALIALVYTMAVTWWIRIDDFILVPRTEHLSVGADLVRHTVKCDGGVVEIFSAPARVHADSFVLRFAGNDVRAEEVVDQISQRWGGDRTEVWCMNYPGSGASSGPAELDRVGPAALAAFDAVQREARGRPIFLDGNSFGATVALHVAANRSIAGAILQNPPPIREMARSKFSGPMLWLVVWPVSLQVPASLDPVANAARSNAPAVFIHSNHDDDVPDRFQRLIRDAYRGAVRQMNLDGDHDTVPDDADPVNLAAAVRWLRENARPVASIPPQAAGLNHFSLAR